jgi:2-aminoadipate transaminase
LNAFAKNILVDRQATSTGPVAVGSGNARRRLPTLQFEDRPGILDLSWGHPHAALLPTRQWAAATQQTLTSFGWQAMTYGYAAGPGPLIEWLAEHLSGLEQGASDLSQFFVTAGASHALALVSTLLASPGDIVLVDAPTYHFALRILLDRGVQLVRAPTDEDGIDPAALGILVTSLRTQGRRVAMLYLVPTFGNPTGRSLSGERRRDLVRVAHRTGLTIVEDDTYRELCYQASAPQSLWRLDEGQLVVRIGSFSKTVAPGLRLGWVNAGGDMVRRLTSIGYIDSGGGVNHATALAMATFGVSGAYCQHVAHVRHAYKVRRDVLVEALRSALPGLQVPSPAGGWFLWLPLPEGITATELLPAAEQRGVSFAAGSQFYPDGQGGERHIRLSFSFLTVPQLAEASLRLAAAVTDLRS